MEEILSEFRAGQSHFRKVLIFSIFVVILLAISAISYIVYLENIKLHTENKYAFSNNFNKNNYFLTANLIGTTTDKVFFKLMSDDINIKHFAYFDDRTINKLATSTKIGDSTIIYSRTPIDVDKDGFIIREIGNYYK